MRPQLDTIATLLDQGAADSAVRMLRSSWEPELPAAERIPLYCMWIRGLCDTGDTEHAVTLARRAAAEFPHDADIVTALGNVLDIAQLLDEARDAFELAVALDGSSVLQHYNLGAVLERLGDEARAETHYRTAIEIENGNPTMVEASGALGSLLRRQGRLQEAEEVYEAYLAEDPLEVEMLVEHGICLSDLHRLEDAIDRFELAISLESDHPSAWYNLAITLFRQGRYDDAHEAMRTAHRSDPRNPLALAVLGAWGLSDKDADLDNALSLLYGAIELVRELSEQGELGNGYASLVVEEVFEALWQNGRKDEAREVARVAGRNDWITPHMLDTLNRSDYGEQEATSAFKVTARARIDLERPEDWPVDAGGYTTDLTVIALDEDQARAFTISYLRELEPSERVHFDVRVVGRGSALQEPEGMRRPPGVARVDGYRAYFREDIRR